MGKLFLLSPVLSIPSVAKQGDLVVVCEAFDLKVLHFPWVPASCVLNLFY